ncbi:hypothetical protein A5906_05460 [Bradyrhizobium sacchari]|nr:hypothetical protein A5906_05460 [Bradyrhizobium sacchari]
MIGAPPFRRSLIASEGANRLLTGRLGLATIKTPQVVHHKVRSAPLAAHLGYLHRERVTRDGGKAGLFGPDTESADLKLLGERECQGRNLREP